MKRSFMAIALNKYNNLVDLATIIDNGQPDLQCK